jgi:hypothetical protein
VSYKVFNHYENIVLKIIESIENIKSPADSKNLYLSVGFTLFFSTGILTLITANKGYDKAHRGV